ncbi:MAG: type II secretion system F family protein [Oceanococcus sp.]
MISDVVGAAAPILIVLLVAIAVAAAAGFATTGLANFGQDYQKRFLGSARSELRDMFIFMDPASLFLINLVVLAVAPVLIHLLFQLWVVTLATAGLLLVLPGTVWRTMRKRRMYKFEAQLPDAFMMLSSGLQAGVSLNMALETMVRQSPVPLSEEFGLLVKRLRLGVSLDDALIEMEKRMPLQSFVMASSAIRISREVGGNLVETIKSMADTLRRRKSMEGKIESLTAQGKTQGKFMAFLPMVLAVMLSFLEPESMRKLYTTREGLMVLFVMIVMQVLGFVFIRKITTIDS